MLNITIAEKDLEIGELCINLLQQDRWKNQFDNQNTVASLELAMEANLKGEGKIARKMMEDAVKVGPMN